MTVQEAQVDNLHETDEEFVDELTPGTQLMHGQYTIESFLNSGGFGITYLARDSLDRLVVIKECFPGSFCRRQNASVVARSRAHQAELRSIVRLFTQEARSLAKAGHPNIVGVHQVFEDNGTAYMALDYVEGMDLLEIITESPGLLTPAQIRSYLVKMLDAISFVHKQGILHRDISPDNILIRSDNEPVLIDFGAAREEASKQSRLLSALRVVKDGYSPQEFYVAGSEQSNSCDLYSLAASFYHIITGELPPDSQMRLAAAAAGDEDPFVPLGKRTNDYDEVFCAALDKAMSVLPRERIQTAEEWLAMLNGEAPVEQPKTNAATSKRTATPRKVQAAAATEKSKMPLLLASTAIVLGVGAVAYFATQNGAEAPEVAQTTPSFQAPAVQTPEIAQTAPTVAAPGVAQTAPSVAAPEVAQTAPAIETPDTTAPTPPAVNITAPSVVETVEAPTSIVESDAPTALGSEDQTLALATPAELPRATAGTPFDNISNTPPAPRPTPPAALTPDTLPSGVELVTPNAPDQLPAGVERVEQLPAGVERVEQLPAGVERVEQLPAGVERVEQLPAGVERVEQPAAERSGQLPAGVEFLAPLPEGVEFFAPTQQTAALAQEPTSAAPAQVTGVSGNTSHAGLPFAFSNIEPGVVTNVLPGAPFWVAPGTRVLTINGEPVVNTTQTAALIERLSQEAGSNPLRLDITTEAQVSGAAIDRSLTLPVVYNTTLGNGLGFQAKLAEGDSWVTQVAETPSGSPFEIGDEIVAFMPTSERIDGEETLGDIVSRELASGRTDFSFAIKRDGQMWVENFNLTNQ